MSWEVTDRMTIYREEGFYALSPCVNRTPNGDLLMTFQRAPHIGMANHKHPLFNVQACRSSDEGRTWSDAYLVTIDPLGGVMDRSCHTLPDGSIFLHSSCSELVPVEGSEAHGLDWTVRFGMPFWVRSTDDGHTWSKPVRFPPLPDAINAHPSEHTWREPQRAAGDAGRTAVPAEQGHRHQPRVPLLRHAAYLPRHGRDLGIRRPDLRGPDRPLQRADHPPHPLRPHLGAVSVPRERPGAGDRPPAGFHRAARDRPQLRGPPAGAGVLG